jgi:TRAP-type uncharacterized transport system fused permease subunit
MTEGHVVATEGSRRPRRWRYLIDIIVLLTMTFLSMPSSVLSARWGILMGLLVLACARNLWAVIIGHGLFDASRFVLPYFEGPPTG